MNAPWVPLLLGRDDALGRNLVNPLLVALVRDTGIRIAVYQHQHHTATTTTTQPSEFELCLRVL